MIQGVYISQALRTYIVITNFGSKQTYFSCKNVVDNLILEHCYCNVVFDLEWFREKNHPLKILFSAVGGTKISFNRMLYTFFCENNFFSFLTFCKLQRRLFNHRFVRDSYSIYETKVESGGV